MEVAAEEVVDSRLRRSCRLTEGGAAVLAAEARRRQEQSAAALGRLGALGYPS
ncbi:hypothetical protein [Streptomyces sp. NP160]|uniref:hypothetical protein n=1 Tax=Streptomyces sp. NP160 TaxID=2586637 RepID=UPI0027D87879|nr:hypothetical protein [Streptomyces sp. NP160]